MMVLSASIAQWLERRPSNPSVVCSSPVSALWGQEYPLANKGYMYARHELDDAAWLPGRQKKVTFCINVKNLLRNRKVAVANALHTC